MTGIPEIPDPNQYNELTTKGIRPVVVLFSADWCGPCKFLHPTIEEIAGNFGKKAAFLAVDIEKHQELTAEQGVQSVPTVKVYNKGECVATLVGARTKDDYESILKPLVGAK